MSSNFVRLGVVGAVLAGLAWIIAAIVEGATLAPGAVLAAYLAAWLGTLGGLAGLHARQTPRHGWPGTIGFFVAFLGAALALVGNLLTLIGTLATPTQQTFVAPAFGLGFILGYAGIGLFGIGFAFIGAVMIWARSMPMWCGVVIILGLLIALLAPLGGSIGASVVLGLMWLALGYALPSPSSAASEQPSRVR